MGISTKTTQQCLTSLITSIILRQQLNSSEPTTVPEAVLVVAEELRYTSDPGYRTFLRELMYSLHINHTLMKTRGFSTSPTHLLGEIINNALENTPPEPQRTCINFAAQHRILLESYLSCGDVSETAWNYIT